MPNYPRSIKTALNRFAHAEGQAHAERVKARLMADLEALRASGATHMELLAHIERQEHDGSEGRPE